MDSRGYCHGHEKLNHKDMEPRSRQDVMKDLMDDKPVHMVDIIHHYHRWFPLSPLEKDMIMQNLKQIDRKQFFLWANGVGGV